MLAATSATTFGGKFANGAAFAAFASIVSSAAEAATSDSGGTELGADRFTAEQKEAIQKEIALAVSDVPEGGFSSETVAAKYLRSRLQPIAENYNIEIGSYIFSDNSGASFNIYKPVTSFHSHTILRSVHPPRLGHAPFHTHQTAGQFSGKYGDTSIAEQSGANSYLSNTEGLLRYRAPDFQDAWRNSTSGSRPTRRDYIEWVK